MILFCLTILQDLQNLKVLQDLQKFIYFSRFTSGTIFLADLQVDFEHFSDCSITRNIPWRAWFYKDFLQVFIVKNLEQMYIKYLKI